MSLKSKVLFISHSGDWIGPTNSLLLLIKHLRHRFECHVLMPGEGEFIDELRSEGLSGLSLPTLGKSQLLNIVGLIRSHDVDLVYGNTASSATKNALIAAKLARRPFIYHLRAMAGNRNWRRVEFLRFADATVSVSRATADSYGSYLKESSSFVVYNGIELSAWRQDRGLARAAVLTELGIADNSLILISVGNLDHRKDPAAILLALPALLEAQPTAHLLIVGRTDRDTEYSEAFSRKVIDLGLQDRVSVLGFRRDLPPLLAASDIFVHTAKSDPHPRAVIEAMAAGLPVVAFSVDGVSETVLQGNTGCLLEPGDTGALRRALIELSGSAGLRVEMGAAGRARAAEVFSAEGTAERVGDIIAGVLRERELGTFPAD